MIEERRDQTRPALYSSIRLWTPGYTSLVGAAGDLDTSPVLCVLSLAWLRARGQAGGGVLTFPADPRPVCGEHSDTVVNPEY